MVWKRQAWAVSPWVSLDAAARRELRLRSRLTEPDAIAEDTSARLDVEALNDTDRIRGLAAAESLLGWLDRRARERSSGG